MQKESNRPKMYFSLKLNSFAFLTTLREGMSMVHEEEGHLFVLDLLVGLPVVGVQLDALRQLALNNFSLL